MSEVVHSLSIGSLSRPPVFTTQSLEAILSPLRFRSASVISPFMAPLFPSLLPFGDILSLCLPSLDPFAPSTYESASSTASQPYFGLTTSLYRPHSRGFRTSVFPLYGAPKPAAVFVYFDPIPDGPRFPFFSSLFETTAPRGLTFEVSDIFFSSHRAFSQFSQDSGLRGTHKAALANSLTRVPVRAAPRRSIIDESDIHADLLRISY